MGREGKRRPLLDTLKRQFPGEDGDMLYAWILCGEVFVDGERTRDPKRLVDQTASIVRYTDPDVGRGALKLRSVLPDFVAKYPDLLPQDRVILDAGSSTGGFVQVLLEEGAKAVIAVDVGRNQLAFRLRTDPRVISMEGTNALSLDPEMLPQMPHFCTADLSFRSLERVALHLSSLSSTSLLLALVKPQFERSHTPGLRHVDTFDGVVDDEEIPVIMDGLRRRLELEGLQIIHTLPSGIRGGSGNQEYFALLGPA